MREAVKQVRARDVSATALPIDGANDILRHGALRSDCLVVVLLRHVAVAEDGGGARGR